MNKNTLQETYKMTVEILTPVSISDNKKLNAKEYLYDNINRIVYFLNELAWHKFIYTHNLMNKYENYMIKASSNKSLYSWLQSCGYNITNKDLQSAIISKTKAYVDLTKDQNKKTLNDIICQTKLINGTPYIPGSSLKGAIRTAILYDLLMKNPDVRSKFWQKSIRNLSKIKVITAERKKISINDITNIFKKTLLQIEKDLLHKLKLYDENNTLIDNENAVCSVMRGIIISDSEYTNQTVPMAILRKIDLYLDKKGHLKENNSLPVFRECILPNIKFNFQLKLDKTMTAKIGINSVDDLLHMLQNYFDFINKILKNAFGKESEYLFSQITDGNIYFGGNTGFLNKTLVASLAPTRRETVNFIRTLLDITFGKHKNDKISPRTLKATKYNGNNVLMGVGKITVC